MNFARNTAVVRNALALILSALTVMLAPAEASDKPASVEDSFAVLQWRNVGPNRGGRSIAVAGHASRPFEYYFGATGGGLWKTMDGGTTWRPVTDGQIRSSSVGAVTVAPSNPDIVYIGMGEGQLRSNVMQGDGVYRSDDGGATWRHLGLKGTRTISVIRVHPDNPDIVYAAALGDPFADNEERGVFRSRNGGKSWEKLLYRSPKAGAIDLAMDPANPDVLYATIWQVYRKPWKLWSGGRESGIFKSTDGGDSWTEITANKGLPKGPLGKMTIAVSPVASNLLFANIEANEGGLYRSRDAGQTWQHVNGDRKLWQRSFYFMRLRPDPVDPETLYVLSFRLEKSTDGGASFKAIPTRHADIHDLWIDPLNPSRMIVADDGGGSVSVNAGATWTEQDYPTAQIYRLAVTNDYPRKLCGAQQDNTTICVPSHDASLFGTSEHVDSFGDFETVGPGESGYVATHPAKPGIYFSGGTNILFRYDAGQQSGQDVQPYPYTVMGQAAGTMKERWNWTYPIVFSPFKPHALYLGSQNVWRSHDEGKSWTRISPDLTRAAPETLGETGGPIRLDQDGPEVYGTLYTIAPSPLQEGLIWTGSDDGLVHVTRNDGASWAKVTPKRLPAHTRISFIHASAHDPAKAYLAAKRYEMGDRSPYLFRTTDHGRSWTRIDRGLPAEHFTHTIVEDKLRAGLLFAGTEHGVHVSLDDGGSWHALSLNLPDTQISGLSIVDDALAISTHGRSFYVLEGVNLLRHLAEHGAPVRDTIFPPAAATLYTTPALLHFHLAAPARTIKMSIANARGEVVRRIVRSEPLEAGPHSIVWDLRHDGATIFENMIIEAPNPATGPWVVPGKYTVVLDLDGRRVESSLDVKLDPRFTAVDDTALAAQQQFALQIRTAVSEANQAVLDIRQLRRDILGTAGAGKASSTRQRLLQEIGDVEATLYQVLNESPKDKIAHPIKLNDRLAHLMALVGSGAGAPTEPQRQVFEELRSELTTALARYEFLKRELLGRTDPPGRP